MRPKYKQRKSQVKSNAVNELVITDVSRSGSGFGREQSGRVVFVPFTAPGDKVKVKLTKQKNKYAEGELLEVIEPSEMRIAPKCEVFTQCGGCQWQHLPYDYQWKVKSQGVLESLRLAKIDVKRPVEMFPAEQTWEYRNRIQLRGNGRILGYYARQSHQLVPIQRCDVACAEINDALSSVREEGEKLGDEYKVELNLSLDHTVIRTWVQVHGATGFRQINDEQNEKLRSWIVQRVPSNISVLDLYGGAGNLSIPLIGKAGEIHCVDVLVPDENLSSQQFYFHQSAVYPWLTQRVQQNNHQLANNAQPWLAIIDPPRNGLAEHGEEIIRCLKQHNVEKVIFVGCKPDPWARDLSFFVQQGWKLKEIALFDFFPQTFHIESVALLERSFKPK